MKKTAVILAATALATSLTASAGSPAAVDTPPQTLLESINGSGYGTFSGRLQFVGMHRDIENSGHGHNATLGALLNYTTPAFGNFDMGAAYNYAGTLFDSGKTSLLSNDDIHVLNEAWLRYNLETVGLEKSHFVAGRRITNGEVFRTDDFRQKARSLETAQINSNHFPDLNMTLGHATGMSNWMASGDKWEFNNFGDVFGTGYETDGVTWAEGLYTGIAGWEISLFNAYAWDITNLLGARIQYKICDEATLIGYYRHESDIGRALDRDSDAYGLSYQQKIGKITLEPGYFTVQGDGLRFQEVTTGINHPLGISMMIYCGQFSGGAQTAYLKAGFNVGKTVFYALYNSTWHNPSDFHGQELNVVIKHPITDQLSACFKGGLGHRDWKNGLENSHASDARLFITYTF